MCKCNDALDTGLMEGEVDTLLRSINGESLLDDAIRQRKGMVRRRRRRSRLNQNGEGKRDGRSIFVHANWSTAARSLATRIAVPGAQHCTVLFMVPPEYGLPIFCCEDGEGKDDDNDSNFRVFLLQCMEQVNAAEHTSLLSAVADLQTRLAQVPWMEPQRGGSNKGMASLSSRSILRYRMPSQEGWDIDTIVKVCLFSAALASYRRATICRPVPFQAMGATADFEKIRRSLDVLNVAIEHKVSHLQDDEAEVVRFLREDLAYAVEATTTSAAPSADFVGELREFQVLQNRPLENFAMQAKEYGTITTYHGSSFENFYSILQHGLKPLSDTAYQRTGAMYGSGIYLSTSPSVARSFAKPCSVPFGGKLRKLHGLVRCSVIRRPRYVQRAHGEYIIVDDADDVRIDALLLDVRDARIHFALSRRLLLQLLSLCRHSLNLPRHNNAQKVHNVILLCYDCIGVTTLCFKSIRQDR